MVGLDEGLLASVGASRSKLYKGRGCLRWDWLGRMEKKRVEKLGKRGGMVGKKIGRT